MLRKRDGGVCIGYKVKNFKNDRENDFGLVLSSLKDSQATLTAVGTWVVKANYDL